ncbi:MAG: S1 RNA-binding domain-containing protein [Anaerolineaceae bacterium]
MAEKREWLEGDGVEGSYDEGWWSSLLADESMMTAALLKQESYQDDHPVEKMDGKRWELVKKLYEQDEIMTFEVRGFNRGGLLVTSDGIQGFVPISHIVALPPDIDENQRQAFLADYVGRTIELKVIECEPSMERIVLSERAAKAGCGKRKQLFDILQPGAKVEGTATNITDFGVFLDLGGIEGLVHVSELSWGRVQHPSEVVKIGDLVEALVLQVNEENSRVALSMKRLLPNPWERLMEDCKTGDILTAKITSILKYGAFARVEYGVEGLIHRSSISLLGADSDQSSLQPGQMVQVEILHIDPERRRLGLGLVDYL